ncbi:MAG: discoidin domain-containing protein [Candidatus Omnitrophica bacterium]|nr:discoidin domain-containing protein [Candidatus Omnitrophota bacterium]
MIKNITMRRFRVFLIWLPGFLALFLLVSCERLQVVNPPSGCSGDSPTAPSLTNNPTLDVIATNQRPLLSFFNAKGGIGKRTYAIELDTAETFNSSNLIQYADIPETTKYITEKLVNEDDSLVDNTRYYWCVRAIDSAGNTGPWAKSRFYVNTKSDDEFMRLVRIPVKGVEVSSGDNIKNITDIDDPGQVSFWQSTPPGTPVQWVKFDLEKQTEVSRIWMLSNTDRTGDGWLKDFVWQKSDDADKWVDIEGAAINGNDTYRNIIDIAPVKTRYLRLLIKDWEGYAPQINAVILYSPGMPPVPDAPEGDYVLIVGNQMNGFTFTELAQEVESLGLGLKTLTVPNHEVSLQMLEQLKDKPTAIILSGNNADYPNMPMFEFNGEYEIIRHSDIPILGICCGHQQLAMAYGFTYARSMGWSDISSMEKPKMRQKIKILKDDPIFEGIPNPFDGAEVHGWSIGHLPEGFQVIAQSDYIQAIKNTSRFIYGEQFHAEIQVPYNQSKPYLFNFLRMAKERKCLIK